MKRRTPYEIATDALGEVEQAIAVVRKEMERRTDLQRHELPTYEAEKAAKLLRQAVENMRNAPDRAQRKAIRQGAREFWDDMDAIRARKDAETEVEG